MLVREGASRTATIDIGLAALLSFVAGAVNTAGFHAFGYFLSNMTGNVSAFSDQIALGATTLAATFCAIVVLFVAGAFAASLVIEGGRHRRNAGIYACCILIEGCLLACVGVAAILLPQAQTGLGIVLALSFLMGLQNATTTRISNARVRTTHISGMATDIGIFAALMLVRPVDRSDRADASIRLRLYVCSILAFCLGGIAGVIGHEAYGGAVFLAGALILVAIALPEAMRARRPRP